MSDKISFDNIHDRQNLFADYFQAGTIERVVENDMRFYKYQDDDKLYPSITTVLAHAGKKDLGFENWLERVGIEEAERIRDERGRHGTIIHNHIENMILEKRKLETDNLYVQSLMRPFETAISQNLTELYAVEQFMISKKLGVAGTVDLVGKWNDKIAVIDWKTSKNLKDYHQITNYFIQGCAYTAMFYEMTGTLCDEIVIVMGIDGVVRPSIFRVDPNSFIRELMKRIRQFNKEHMS